MFLLLFFITVVVFVGWVAILLSISLVPFDHIRLHVQDKLLDSLQIVRRKLFNIVMTGAIDIVRWILILSSFVQLLSMVKWYDFIAFAMDYVNGALNIGHSIDVWEFIKR